MRRDNLMGKPYTGNPSVRCVRKQSLGESILSPTTLYAQDMEMDTRRPELNGHLRPQMQSGLLSLLRLIRLQRPQSQHRLEEIVIRVDQRHIDFSLPGHVSHGMVEDSSRRCSFGKVGR